MAAPRLPFLWPILFRPVKATRPTEHIRMRKAPLSRNLTTTPLHAQGPVKRYGKAHEPAPHLVNKEAWKDGDEVGKPTESAPEPTVKSDAQKTLPEPMEEEEEEEPATTTPSTPSLEPTLDTPKSAPSTTPPAPPKTGDAKPIDTVLHMPSPAEEEQRKPPHLKPPPYVHHFDTYGLVKGLAKSGFSEEQAVTVMKAVRGILTGNMELARHGLVSKSNVENGTYLFRAACSELKTEVGNTRKSETEKMRSERTQLQHELDILNQKLTQETASLKDEMKGLFDDRKMLVRQEQRTMDTKIQELNYKITVALNSDARSEVEGLRWVLTRRAAIAVAVSAFILFASLRYSSYVNHLEAEQKKNAKGRRPPPDDDDDDRGNNSPSYLQSNNSNKEEPLGEELLATEGVVSLG
ncbi:hypothetical protein K504DRAFT_375578 [Pleomassaria siparia CBS 279.74]|uniref:DUF1640-domain-containing protein n=1 Tax=Pleomassaria siparia CBS 279.74 TaxID=1314801 RepID=A0A6G1KD06_9PLEO|nr:hypothetical protein K504DRAFT_375578 [Pleomassaria siparia CBS 279.74]